MDKDKPSTQFAPAERSSKDEVQRQKNNLETESFAIDLLNKIPDIIVILNKHRQIVYANNALYEALDINDSESVLGFRPGELLSCVHASESEGGCGTTEFCRTCGAVKAIITALEGKKDCQECRIISSNGDAFDFRVSTNPINLNNENYSVFSISDISDEKRKALFEKLFFHDIINTAGGMKGFIQVLKDADPTSNIEKCVEMLDHLSNNLIDEIMAQKYLTDAENNELAILLIKLKTVQVIEDVIKAFQYHQVSESRYLKIDKHCADIIVVNDKSIIRRIIGNMIKNALEAVNPGETVSVGCRKQNDYVEFWVHNPGFIPRHVQLQIFQRSFSTKGKGRGLGTYSMKLLSERYLKGRVSFTSSIELGTRFSVLFPVNY